MVSKVYIYIYTYIYIYISLGADEEVKDIPAGSWKIVSRLGTQLITTHAPPSIWTVL